MKAQTKAVRDALKKSFPDVKGFSVKYKESYSYINSVERIEVGCPKEIELDAVIKSLEEYTDGVYVYKTGNFVKKVEIPMEGYFISPRGYRIDAELIGYIEVKSI